MHVDDVGQRPEPVQQAQQRAPLEPLGEGPEEEHRDRREHQVVDDALDQRHPVDRPVEALDHRSPQGEGERDDGRGDDRDAGGAGGERRAPQPDVGLSRLGLDLLDQGVQIARRLGQPALAEAGLDAAFELRDGRADVLRDELDLVARRARRRHVPTVGVRHARTGKLAFGAPKAWLRPILGPTPRTRRNAMGFMDSIKEALGGDRGDDADATAASTPAGPSTSTPTPRSSAPTAARPPAASTPPATDLPAG